MQLKLKLMLYKWLFNVNHWPYSPLLVYYLKFKCPLRASQETYGMYKYFYERFWMMVENNVPITLRKMSQFNTWKDLKILKCLQNLQSFIFFIFGVEKLWKFYHLLDEETVWSMCGTYTFEKRKLNSLGLIFLLNN